jgi:predicted short-subunit dehydrogenase-like oxidoreductase (DUF2520 family)
MRLAASGVEVVGAHCRSESSAARASTATGIAVTHGTSLPDTSAAEVVVVAVPDPAIRSVAEQLAASGAVSGHQVVLHCSGARSSEELAPLRHLVRGVGSFHPLLSFADPALASRLLREASYAAEGDADAMAAAERLAAALGGRLLRIGAADRALYHAAAATASNHLVALAAQAAECLAALGIDRADAVRALVPLMRSTLDNLGRLGLPGALTGPVSRGDAACVAGHLEALAARTPAELPPYLAMAARALAVAREQGVARPAALDEVERVLRATEDRTARR